MKKSTMWIIGIIAVFIFLNQANEEESIVSMDSLSGHTTISNNHIHVFTVDIEGNGATSLNIGHSHTIYHFRIIPADGHTHELAR